jgi:predicted amidohydrolase YtcJ
MKNIDAAIIRPRLEHAQILTQADIKRIASLGSKSGAVAVHFGS